MLNLEGLKQGSIIGITMADSSCYLLALDTLIVSMRVLRIGQVSLTWSFVVTMVSELQVNS